MFNFNNSPKVKHGKNVVGGKNVNSHFAGVESNGHAWITFLFAPKRFEPIIHKGNCNVITVST